MTLRRKRWQIAPPSPPDLFERFSTLEPLVVQVLYNRGLIQPEQVEAFLTGRVKGDDPFTLAGMTAAVRHIREAIRSGWSLVVYGDYDLDGMAATAILVRVVRSLGANVSPYIPDRGEEGYGLNEGAIRKLAEEGARLLITVDCGIRSLDEVALARRLGMQVIVTDHHHVGAALPVAEAVVNPRRSDCPYPFKDLAGVGVAFKVAQALLRVEAKVPLSLPAGGEKSRFPCTEDDLVDLVALGTIADMVPLQGENHALVRRGLARINAAPCPGLQALMNVARVEPGTVTASRVSFSLAPRLNAAGRIGEALRAYRLLLSEESGEAGRLAGELEALNAERRVLTQRVRREARRLALAEGDSLPLLFAASPRFPSGIVGLAAGHLLEEFYRPAVVVEVGEEFSKGSARSIPEFHITGALDRLGGLLERHGGHAAAAGFTIRTERLSELRAQLMALASEELSDITLAPVLAVDAEIPLRMLSWELLQALETLAPFGYGNPAPLLVSRRVQVGQVRAVGADGRHLKLSLLDELGHAWDAIAFRQGAWMGRLPPRIDLAYQLERNNWNGRTQLQLNVQDINAPDD